MKGDFDLQAHGITVREIVRNGSVGQLYEHGVLYDGAEITSSGALAASSGEKTGRSPKDKRVVDNPQSTGNVWWGNVNVKLPDSSFEGLRKQTIEFLNKAPRLYVIDGFAGWDKRRQLKIRVICARPYHALFMHNMLIRPTAAELSSFGKPDYTIYNAGQAQADASIPGVNSKTNVTLNFERGEFVILGTQYAGEMKKGVFTLMNYLMPRDGVLSMHCSANEGATGDVSLFFGLSGTGKTTLSADAARRLIGDDEHCWSDDGVFNIEGGCYAKCINLSAEKEPEIYSAVRYGAILENTVMDPQSRAVDYDNSSLTENTRAAYPIEFIPNAKIPCVGQHPKNIIFLTCDAFGVLPPVSKLTPEQAMYHFISGYTAKVAGTEMGVTEPQATFSACFGTAFLVWHPTKYAEMLAEKMRNHKAQAWLVNTGWTGGGHGVGRRMSLPHTRSIIDAIHSGELLKAPTAPDEIFGFAVPTKVSKVPDNILRPEAAWADKGAFRQAAEKLAGLFHQNFKQYDQGAASDAIRSAGPRSVAVATA